MVTAVLVDTVSIQNYVFAGNKLKENLGASQLVENIYKGELSEVLNKITSHEVDLNKWKEKPDEFIMINNSDIECEIGYIGGGNSLIFFRTETLAKEFIYNWTKRLLINAPGLQTAVAVGKFNLDGNFKEQLDNLYSKLNENKNIYFPNTTLSKYGITADCPLSGLSAEIYHHEKDTGRYISSLSNAKINASSESQKLICKNFKKVLKDKYTFTSEIDKLGQRKSENHIAIVHIDGNGMGKRFKNCSNLVEIRKLSLSVAEATIKSFNCLLQYIIDKIDLIEDDTGFQIHEEHGKRILPIRPIVLAGDDITFVTDGRLGVHLAEKFIEFWTNEKVSDGEPLTACAGVAIIKTQYPFYRGYKLAEELCASAKKESREIDNGCFLDFYIATGGFSGSLEQIRKKHYRVEDGALYYGPYILDKVKDNEKSIYKLKQGIRQMIDKNKWPRSKVKELRSVLTLGKEATKQFILDLNIRGIHLPEVSGSYSSEGWENSVTPYFDMVELMEFYPEYFLEIQ
ncbi:hypothetical protein [Desulfolucanica intricata]|uniref:hypothetical protein n=1 Tax=Desulfolucanica intricata TaxID=1285191 RepID=UPI000829F02E|nr:hypothetical protein [Desulfolucanica intricata]